MNGKALEQRTALAVSAWPVPLSPLGFSASNPITGSESLAYWCSFMPSLSGVPPPSLLGCAVAEIFVGYTRPCLRMVSCWLKISL